MPISFQPANKAELRVTDQTSLEDLQKFQESAAAKGGGQLRAINNADGSRTLYVAADSKFRLSSLFKGYGQAERAQKQALASEVVKDLISLRLPRAAGDAEPAKDKMARLLGNVGGPRTVGDLGTLLDQTKKLQELSSKIETLTAEVAEECGAGTPDLAKATALAQGINSLQAQLRMLHGGGQSELLKERSGLQQQLAKLDESLRAQVDGAVGRRTDAIAGSGTRAGSVQELDGQVKELRALQDGAEGLITDATSAKIDTVIAAKQGEINARLKAAFGESAAAAATSAQLKDLAGLGQQVGELGTKVRGWSDAAPEFLGNATGLREEIAALKGRVAEFGTEGHPEAVKAKAGEQEQQLAKLDESLRARVDGAVTARIAAITGSGTGAGSVQVLNGQIEKLEALSTAVRAEPQDLVTQPTKNRIDQAITELTGRRANAGLLAQEAQQLIDGANQCLRAGGGLSWLTVGEVPRAISLLGEMDALIARNPPDAGPLKVQRQALADAVGALVDRQVGTPDSLAALLGKVEQLQGLGLAKGAAAISQLGLKDRLIGLAQSVYTEVAGALGRGRAEGSVSGAVAKARELALLAKEVSGRMNERQHSAAAGALDRLILAADPQLREGLQKVQDDFVVSLRAALEGLPPDLRAAADEAAQVKAHAALVLLESALSGKGSPDVEAWRTKVTTARESAFASAQAAITEGQRAERDVALAIAEPGKKAEKLLDLLGRMPGQSELRDEVRREALGALGAQTAELRERITWAGTAVPAGEERAAITRELRSLDRNLSALEAVEAAAPPAAAAEASGASAPPSELADLRANLAEMQGKDASNQLGPKARSAVVGFVRGNPEREVQMNQALQRLYKAGALTQPAFTDRLEIIAGDERTAAQLVDLAKGDTATINGHFKGVQWDATALRLKKLALDPAVAVGQPPVSAAEIELDHRLLGAKRAIDFALRAANPEWRQQERTRQLQRNADGQDAGGLMNVRYDKKSVAAFLAAGEKLKGKGFDLESIRETLALVVHLESRAAGLPEAETAALVRQVKGPSASVSDAEVLAGTEVGSSFASEAGRLALADRLGDFSAKITGSRDGDLLEAMVRFGREAGDGRPEASLLVDRLSAQSLVRAEKAGARLELQPGQKLYLKGWLATFGQLDSAEKASIGRSALLINSLVNNSPIRGDFLDSTAAALALKPGLERGAKSGASGVFKAYFGEPSADFLKRPEREKLLSDVPPRLAWGQVKLDEIRALQQYVAQPVTVADRTVPLTDHVDRLMASVGEPGFPERARDLIAALPRERLIGDGPKEHLARLVSDLAAVVDGGMDDRANLGVARRRLEALMELPGRIPSMEQYADQQKASEDSRSWLGRMTGGAPPKTLGTFPPSAEKAEGWRNWARAELGVVNRIAPDLIRVANAAMLEQFSASSYTDFGAFQRDLVGGGSVDPEVTRALTNALSERLAQVGLGSLTGATGADQGPGQVVSLLRLELLAYPTAEGFLDHVGDNLPSTAELTSQTEGLLQAHLETYTQEASLLGDQVKRLLPGQELEIELTSSGSLRLSAPVVAPGVSATAGFSAARANSVTVTREGDAFTVVCKSATSGGVSVGVSALGDRVAAAVNAGGHAAAGTVLDFASRPGEGNDAASRVGVLLSGLFSHTEGRAPADLLRACQPDRLRCLDGSGAYVGVEARAGVDARLPGDLDSVSLSLDVHAAAEARIAVSNETNDFEHRRTAQTSYLLSAGVAAGLTGSSSALEAGAALTMTKEKTLVTELGVVTTGSYTRNSVAVETSVNGSRRQREDFDRMLKHLELPADLLQNVRAQIDTMRRQQPVSIAVRRQLTPEAVAELAKPQQSRQGGVSAGDILNNQKNYVLSALEFTVPGREVVGPEEEEDAAEAEDAAGEAAEPLLPEELPGADVINAAIGAYNEVSGVVSDLSEAASQAVETAAETLQDTGLETFGFNVSFATESTAAMRGSRVFTLPLAVEG